MSQKVKEIQIDTSSKTKSFIPDARLISDFLITKIRVNIPFGASKGKALLLDQIPYSKEKTKSAVLQETEDGSFVAFEVDHKSNEDVSKQFRREKKSVENSKIQTYPTWFLLIVLGGLYGLIFKKLAIDKVPILLESHHWTIILLLLLIVVIIELFILYWMVTNEIDVVYFSSESLPKNKVYLFRYNKKIYQVMATMFKGEFFTLENSSDKHLRGYSPEEVQSSLKNDNGELIVEVLDEKQLEKYMLQNQLMEQFQIYKRAELKEKTSKLKENSEILSLESSEEDSDLDAKAEKTKYDSLKKEIDPKIKTLEAEIKQYEKQYDKAMKAIIGDRLEKKRKEIFLNSEEVIEFQSSELTKYKIKEMRLTRIIQGLYQELGRSADDFNERVVEARANDMNQKYDIIHQINVNNGQTNSSSNGYSRDVDKQSSFNWFGLIGPVVWTFSILVVVYIIVWAFQSILDAFGGLGGWAVFAMVLFLIIIIVVMVGVSKFVNRTADFAGNRSTIKLA